MVAEQEGVGHVDGPDQRYTKEAHIRISQQRSAAGLRDVKVGGRRERLDQAYGTKTRPKRRRDDQSAHDDETGDGEQGREGGGAMLKKPRDLENVVFSDAKCSQTKVIFEAAITNYITKTITVLCSRGQQELDNDKNHRP